MRYDPVLRSSSVGIECYQLAEEFYGSNPVTVRKFSSTPGRNGKPILTGEQAREIFMLKPEPLPEHRGRAGIVAVMYGVSAKTVRDIWVGRTWYRETYSLDQTKMPVMDRLIKKAGRPKGIKDKKPRTKKIIDPSDDEAALLTGRNLNYYNNFLCNRNDTDYEDSARGAQSEEVCEVQYPAVDVDNFEDPFHDDWAYWPAQVPAPALSNTNALEAAEEEQGTMREA